jgi:hypothetical protein
MTASHCPVCSTALAPEELDHTMCRLCAARDLAARLGGLLGLTEDWYQEPDEPEDR